MVTIFKNGSPFRIEVQDIWSGRTYVAIYSDGTVGKFVEYALKSDLFHNGFITDPNTATVPFTLVNGWDSNVTNAPDDIKGSWGELTTTWVYSEQIGSLTDYRMQKIVSDKNITHTRTYSNSKWSEWK